MDDDEANVFEQGNQHGGRSPESEDYSFSDGYAQEEQDSQNKRRIPASDLDEHKEVSVPPTKFRKVDGNSDGEPVVDTQGVYSDMYMTGGLGPGNFWDTQKINTRKNQTQKNKFMKITDPKNKYFVHMSRWRRIHSSLRVAGQCFAFQNLFGFQ